MKIIVAFIFCFQIQAGFSQAKNFRFADIVELSAIQKIEVVNNQGRHFVTKAKLAKIKKELGKMTSGQNSVKVGIKQIIVYINNKRHFLMGATHGSIIEVPAAIATKNKQLFGNQNTLYFNANGLNIDNY